MMRTPPRSLRVATLRWSARLVQRVKSLLTGLWHGLWLGVLDNETAQEFTDAFYSADTFYRDQAGNQAGLMPWEIAALDNYFPDSGHLMVFGAGGGREVIALAKRGYRVSGFECNESLVQAGRSIIADAQVDASIQHAPPNAVPSTGCTFDAVIVGWGVYPHIPDRALRLRLLRELRASVRAGAPILLSFGTRTGTERSLALRYHIARMIRALRPGAPPVLLGDILGDAFSHLFTRAEIEQELNSAGLQLVYYSETGFGHALARCP